MADPSTYAIIQALPTPTAYHDLRKLAGLTPPPLEDVPKALRGGWACFLLIRAADVPSTPLATEETYEGEVVGMARLVGDGALFLDVVDVAVHPTHQKQGLGKRLLQAVVDHVDQYAPNAYVSLVADLPGGPPLYTKFGFLPTAPNIGMYRCERVRLRRKAQGL
jgi:GNAT superfamily N-acetyltransferase